MKTFYLHQDKTVAEIGQLLDVGRAIIYRYLAHWDVFTSSTMTTGAKCLKAFPKTEPLPKNVLVQHPSN